MEKISVVIPSYNTGKSLPRAIESIQKQTCRPDEIIVVDDGSEDDTKSVVKNIPGDIQYHFQENKGVASARNKGLDLATGDLITFIDADDIWVENKIEIQLDLLKKKPEADVIIGFLQRIYPINNKTSAGNNYNYEEEAQFALSLGCALIRKKVFKRVGLFNEDMKLSEDLDWFLRVRESNINVFVHDDIVQYYRQHNNNITQDGITTKRYMLKAFKKSLDRRRKAGGVMADFLPSFDNLEEIKKYWNSV